MGPRRLTALFVGALLIAALAASPASAGAAQRHHRADGRLGDWRGKPTMLSGRSQISRGELIYTDFLYDDYGPDLNGAPDIPQFRDNLAPKSGDYGYPDDPARYGYNAADLRELRLALDRRGLHVLLFLQTMKVKDAALATLAIDRDGKATTGQGQWPNGAGLASPGADRFLTFNGASGQLSGDSGAIRNVHVAANLKRNAIEAFIPRRALGRLTRRARVSVGVGLAGNGLTYMSQGSGTPVFDLAFQGAETYDLNSHWGDQRQSAALADADVGGFSGALRPGALRRHTTHRFKLKPGFYNRIFRSRHSYGEGITLKTDSVPGNAEPMFRGRFQPYGLYVPKGYRQGRKTALLLDGHSLDVNHNEYKAVGFRQLPQLGDERHSLIITPLARGMDTWYLRSGLVDVFEAWRDVRRHYNADPNRTSITGYSMGGYMTYRLGLLMPDAFVRASVYVGPPLYYQWPYPLPPQSSPEWEVRGNTNLIVDNGLNLPFEINHGNADELVPISGVVQQADTFKAAGDPYRFYHHASDDHLGFIVIANQWKHTRDWLGTGRRNLSPVEVRYKRYPSMDLRRDGLVFDGAYWVDKLKVRGHGVDSFGEIDATTFALGGHHRRLVDEGTSPYTGDTGTSPASVTGQHFVKGKAIKERNAFKATLDNLRSVTLLSKRMGLRVGNRTAAKLTGDGATRLRLTGDWGPAVSATLDGRQVNASTGPGGVSLRLPLAAGSAHRLVLYSTGQV